MQVFIAVTIRVVRGAAESASFGTLDETIRTNHYETGGPFVDYREETDEELAAAVFASRIIEPMAAQRLASDAVRRLEETFDDLSDKLF